MKKFLLKIWRILPIWMQRFAAAIIRPRYQVAVGGMIINEHGQILLCEHTYRRLHAWGLPGGDLKFGEDPVDAIKWEILEETGLAVQNARLLLVENSTSTHHVALTYLCTGVSGTFVPSDEVSSIRYYDTNELPGFFKEHRATIEKCLAILDSEKRDDFMNWLEVSLTVNGELAEAVADVLARFAPNGVTTEQAVDFVNDEDEGTPVGPITVRAYLPVDEMLGETRQKLEESLFYLGMIQPLPAPVFTPLADQNWMEAWKANYHPIPIGKRLIIVPAWLESPDASRISIKIDPGMAFGTGTHPTTQLCLELLESYTPKDGDVIDVGCGSGILSIAALKLGAGFALGVDIDEASVKASRENADANGIPADQFTIGLGSVTEVLNGRFLAPSQNGSPGVQNAPLVLANILAPIIIRLFGLGLAKLAPPGGVFILSGILAEQAEGVISSAEEHGLKLVEQRQIGDWVALLMR